MKTTSLLIGALIAGVSTAAVAQIGLTDVPVFRFANPNAERLIAEGDLSFRDVEGALLRSTVVSNVGTIGGDAGIRRYAAPLAGAELQVCEDASCGRIIRDWSAAGTTLSVGNTVRLRVQIGDEPGAAFAVGLTVGSERHEWNVVARADGATIAEIPTTDAAVRNEVVLSDPAALSGYARAELGGNADLRLCADAECSSPVTSWGLGFEALHGQYVQLRMQAPAALGEPRQARVAWGDASRSWTVISEGAASPSPFTIRTARNVFPNSAVASAPVALTGQRGAQPVSSEGAAGIRIRASIDGSAFGDLPAELGEGQTLALEAVSTRPPDGSSINVPLSVGTTSSSWTLSMIDRTPDAFEIAATTEVEPGAFVVSSEVEPTGYDTASDVQAEGARVSVERAEFADVSVLSPGQSFRLGTNAPASWGASSTVNVAVGETSSTWRVSVRPKNEMPAAFEIADVDGLDPREVVVSEAIAPNGYDGPIEVAAVGGTVSVNGRAFETSASINPGDAFTVRATAPSSWLEERLVSIVAGSRTASWTLSTRAQDTAPDGFEVASSEGLNPGATATTLPISLSAYDGPIEVSAEGATVSVSNGPFDQAASINPGQTFRVRAAAATEWRGTRTVTIVAGDTAADWRLVTRAQDVAPDAFVIADARQRNPGSSVTSASIEPVGFDGPIRVVAENALVSVGTGEFVENASIDRGQSFRVRATAPDTWEGERSIRVSVGDTSADWLVSTRAQDVAPDAFSIVGVAGLDPSASTTSGAIRPEGYDGPIAVTATGGTISVNDGPFLASGSINPGQSFRVQATAQEGFGATRIVSVQVGDTSSSWSINTRNRVTAPTGLAFSNVSGLSPNATATSTNVRLTDFDGPVTVSANNGATVSVNGAAYAASASISENQTLSVRATAAASHSTGRVIAVTAGSSSTNWTITTGAAPPPQNVSCSAPWGTTVAHGSSVTAWQSASSSSCRSELRTCSNGTLSGSFANMSCSAPAPTAPTCSGTRDSVANQNNYYFHHSDVPRGNAQDGQHSQAFRHWVKSGGQENRTSCFSRASYHYCIGNGNSDWNQRVYMYLYADLQRAFGSNPSQAWQHWLEFGRAERRISCWGG